MRGFESLFQFLVPLAFLAIWALTSLFNRDAQPLPPRQMRPPQPPPPPGTVGSPQRAPFASSTPQIVRPVVGPARAPARTAPAGWAQAGTAPPSTSTPATSRTSRRAGELDSDEDLLFLTTRSTPNSTRPQSPIAPQKPQRIAPRTRPAAAPVKAIRPPKAKLLKGTDGASMNESMARSYDATPLKMPAMPLHNASDSSASSVRPVADRGLEGGVTRLPDLRALRGSPALLRDAFVLSIIFGPPAAIHRRRP